MCEKCTSSELIKQSLGSFSTALSLLSSAPEAAMPGASLERCTVSYDYVLNAECTLWHTMISTIVF